jgi:hypothetical protein
LLQSGNKILIKTLHIVSPIQRELQPMLHAKFCSQCGEKIKGRWPSPFNFTPLCAACKKQMRLARFGLAAILISLVAGSFLAGRASSPRPAFQFIGQPIELQKALDPLTEKTDETSADGAQAFPESQEVASQEEALTSCGAITKAGRPCRRKIRGSGHCWQHKDNFKGQTKTPR